MTIPWKLRLNSPPAWTALSVGMVIIIVLCTKHLLEDVAPADLATCDFWEHPIGNGCRPYVDEPVTGQEITFEKREGYYLGDVAFDTLTYRVGYLLRMPPARTCNGDVDTFENMTDLDSLAEMESAEYLQVKYLR